MSPGEWGSATLARAQFVHFCCRVWPQLRNKSDKFKCHPRKLPRIICSSCRISLLLLPEALTLISLECTGVAAYRLQESAQLIPARRPTHQEYHILIRRTVTSHGRAKYSHLGLPSRHPMRAASLEKQGRNRSGHACTLANMLTHILITTARPSAWIKPREQRMA